MKFYSGILFTVAFRHFLASAVSHWNDFDIALLAQTYYGRIDRPTDQDAVRFEKLITDAGVPENRYTLVNGVFRNATKSCGQIMQELMMKGCFDSFKCLASLLGDDDDPFYDTFLMADCVEYKKMEYAEYLVDQGVDTKAIVKDIIAMLRQHIYPELSLTLLDWLIKKDPVLFQAQSDIYHDALISILTNSELFEAELVSIAERLIKFGVIISDEMLEECLHIFPRNVVLHEMLRNAQLPDCKEPELD